MHAVVAASIVPLVVAAAPTCLGQSLDFTGPVIFQFESLVRCTAIDDIDGDGRNDLAVAAGMAYIYLQQSDGSFELSDSIGGVEPYWVELADLDGDDHLDLVSGDQVGVRVRFGSGNGTFGSLATYALQGSDEVRQVSCVDLDDDDDIDVVATSRDVLSVLENDGDGVLIDIDAIAVDGNPLGFHATCDLDGDDDHDIVTVGGSGSVTRHLNSGSGDFSSAELIDLPNDEALDGVRVVDLDFDGDNDIATISLFNWDGQQFFGNLHLLENHGSIDDFSHHVFAFSDMMVHLDARDMTGDGRPELVWSDFLGECTVLEHETEDGLAFFPPMALPAAGAWSVRIERINDDEAPDLAISSYGEKLLLYFNGSDIDVPGAPPPPDGPPPAPEGYEIASDLFDDGMAAPLWGGVESDGSSFVMEESDDRLEFSSTGTSGSALAGYVSRRWNLTWADGFKVRAAWHNALDPSPQGDVGACLAVTFEAEPDEDPLDNAIIVRSGVNSAGRFASSEVVVDGVVMAQQSQQLDASDGLLIIEFVPLTNSLILFAGASGQSEPWIVEDLSALGVSGIEASAVYVGGYNDDSSLSFGGNKLSLDTLVVTRGYLPPDVAWFTKEADDDAGTGTRAVALGDLNGDGWDDLVTAAAGDDAVSIRLNTQSAGAGDAAIFGEASSYAVQQHPVAVALADFDDDGDVDIAALNRDSKTVSLLDNDGSGALVAAAHLGMGQMPVALLAADLDGDESIDLAAVNRDAATVSVRFNLAQGDSLGLTFSARQVFDTAVKPIALDAADLDGDGLRELITAHQSIKKVSLLSNLGGSFGAPEPMSVGTRPFAIRAADLNHDGLTDIAVAGRSSDAIAWRLNNGDGTFAPKQSVTTAGKPAALLVADLDGAGHADLAFLQQSWDQLTVMRNLGPATIALPEPFDTPGHPVSLAAADVDHDGDIDIAIAGKATGRVALLLNRRAE
jgi:hypothetical protein